MTKAASKTAAAAEKVAERFVAVFGGPIIDPENGTVYGTEPKAGARTGWLEYQIANGKIALAATE